MGCLQNFFDELRRRAPLFRGVKPSHNARQSGLYGWYS
jgi:hypothetical protein